MYQDMECPYCDWKIVSVHKEAWSTAKAQMNKHLNDECTKRKDACDTCGLLKCDVNGIDMDEFGRSRMVCVDCMKAESA